MTTRVLGVFSCINDGIIGYNDELLFTHPFDFDNFKRITQNKTLLVGYKTAKEIFKRNPNGLPGRQIAILVDSSRPDFPDHKWKSQVDIVIDPLTYITNSKNPVVIAGGQWVLDMLCCHVTEWHITTYPIDILELYEHYDHEKVRTFVVPNLSDPIDTLSFMIDKPDGGFGLAVINTYVV